MKTGKRISQLNNKGLSLVELIVVIAIMAILLGVMTFSIGLLAGTEAKQAYKKVEAALNEAKVGAMSRYEEVLTLKYIDRDYIAANKVDSNGFYAITESISLDKNKDDLKDSIGEEYRRVGAKKVLIGLYLDGATDPVYMAPGYGSVTGTISEVKITYDRKTGAMNQVEVDGSKHDLDKMVFKAGPIRTYTITFDSITGKHYTNS